MLQRQQRAIERVEAEAVVFAAVGAAISSGHERGSQAQQHEPPAEWSAGLIRILAPESVGRIPQRGRGGEILAASIVVIVSLREVALLDNRILS